MTLDQWAQPAIVLTGLGMLGAVLIFVVRMHIKVGRILATVDTTALATQTVITKVDALNTVIRKSEYQLDASSQDSLPVKVANLRTAVDNIDGRVTRLEHLILV